MSPPKRPMPPRPSAVGRTPSFAPGPRAPAKPLEPPSYSPPYTPPDLLDGPTVTGFDPPDAMPPASTDTEEHAAVTYDDPTHLAPEDYGVEEHPPPRSAPPPHPTHSRPPPPSFATSPRSVPPPRPSVPAPRHARHSVAPARPSAPARPALPAPRPSFPPPRASVPAPPRSVPAAANPFLAPVGTGAVPLFDDVNTAFVGGTNMAPDFDALEARASRPDWNKHLQVEQSPPPMRARAHSIDLGEGVVVETLAGFEPHHPKKAELSEAWRPEGLPHTDLLDKPNAMRLESVRPSVEPGLRLSAAPAHLGFSPGSSGAPRVSLPPPATGRPPAASIDLQAEVARASEGKVRVAYVVAGISIVLLIVAILSAVLSVY